MRNRLRFWVAPAVSAIVVALTIGGVVHAGSGRWPASGSGGGGTVTTSAPVSGDGSGGSPITIANGAVALTKLATQADQTIAGNGSGGAASPVALDISASDAGLLATSTTLKNRLTIGKSGGQTLIFDTASGGVGTVTTTSHATKGVLTFGSASFGMSWNEANTSALGGNYILALGTATQGFAGATLSAGGSRAGEAGPWFWNSSSSTVAQTSVFAGQSAAGSGRYARLFQLGTGFTPSGVLITDSGGLEHAGNAGNLVIAKVGSAGDIVLATTASRTAQFTVENAGTLKVGSASMAANGSVATVLGSVGPAGANTTVQEWFVVKNSAGVTRYIPAF
jgi:hypothetical protein